MEIVVKAFTGIFFLTALTFLGIGIISASMDGRNADSFAADCVTKIENSNYASSVIDECKKDAARRRYQLDVTVYPKQGDISDKYGALMLEYYYQIPILGIDDMHYIYSDLR